MLHTIEPKIVAPSLIGLLPKSHYSARAEAIAIDDACRVARFVDLPQPVMFGRQQLGWTLGKQNSPEVMWLPQRRSLDKIVAAGFPTYDSIINAITTNGTRYTAVWSKGATTNPVALNWYDMWPVAGNPVSGTYTGSASSSRQLDGTSTGAMSMMGDVSPSTKHLLSMWANATAGAPQPTLVVYDRCVTYENVPFNNNAINTFTQTNTPTSARYSSGADCGLKIMVTAQTLFNATAQQFTALTYVDQAGVSGQSAPCSTTTTAIIVSAAAPTVTLGSRVVSPSPSSAGPVQSPYMPLAVGDVGVQSVTSFITSAATINTGKMCFVLMHPLATIPLSTLGVTSMMDLVMMIAGLERVFDGACVAFLVYFPVATGATFTGGVDCAWN